MCSISNRHRRKGIGKISPYICREAHMGAYDPLTVEVMRVALNEAWREVREKDRNKFRQSDMAAKILQAAAQGERDPKKLKEAALGIAPDPLNFLAGLAKQVSAEIIGDSALQREGKKQVKASRRRKDEVSSKAQ